jgi:hypothetical protein
MELKDLYAMKGELITGIEGLQGRLSQVNNAIAQEMQKQQQPKPKVQVNGNLKNSPVIVDSENVEVV